MSPATALQHVYLGADPEGMSSSAAKATAGADQPASSSSGEDSERVVADSLKDSVTTTTMRAR